MIYSNGLTGGSSIIIFYLGKQRIIPRVNLVLVNNTVKR